jgi:serine/threonine protein kinase
MKQKKDMDFVNFNGKKYSFDQVYQVSDIVLGEGGYGKVMKGINKLTNQSVAIKFQINQDTNPDFKKEIDILLKIKAICKKYICLDGWGVLDGKFFLAMDMIEGIELLQFHQKINKDQFLYIARQLSKALEKLHSIGISHMDIKPGNIMIDNKLNVKLIDLGISCDTIMCDNSGTPYYMPEGSRDVGDLPLNVRKSMDYYALVVTMAELEANISEKGSFVITITDMVKNPLRTMMVSRGIKKFFKDIIKKSVYFSIMEKTKVKSLSKKTKNTSSMFNVKRIEGKPPIQCTHVINPVTNRNIKIGGKAYDKLVLAMKNLK